MSQNDEDESKSWLRPCPVLIKSEKRCAESGEDMKAFTAPPALGLRTGVKQTGANATDCDERRSRRANPLFNARVLAGCFFCHTLSPETDPGSAVIASDVNVGSAGVGMRAMMYDLVATARVEDFALALLQVFKNLLICAP